MALVLVPDLMNIMGWSHIKGLPTSVCILWCVHTECDPKREYIKVLFKRKCKEERANVSGLCLFALLSCGQSRTSNVTQKFPLCFSHKKDLGITHIYAPTNYSHAKHLPFFNYTVIYALSSSVGECICMNWP